MRREERKLDIVVVRCSNCPFHYVQTVDATIEHGEEHKAVALSGWYCLNTMGDPTRPARPFATMVDADDAQCTSISEYLQKTHGSLFPPECPLPPAAPSAPNVLSGRREIDLT